MKIIDLFSGIGGFALGFQQAGYLFTEHYFSEINKKAIANYKHNFPNAKYLGNIKTIQPADLAGADIITFGSPCQDFSMAGRRAGLSGAKSSLIEYAIALIACVRPSVFIWENVKGVLSSNTGADFWEIIKALTNIGGYTIEWQLLNTAGYYPKIESACTLSDILQDEVHQEYFLSQKMIAFLQQKRKVNHKPKLVPHSKPMAI